LQLYRRWSEPAKELLPDTLGVVPSREVTAAVSPYDAIQPAECATSQSGLASLEIVRSNGLTRLPSLTSHTATAQVGEFCASKPLPTEDVNSVVHREAGHANSTIPLEYTTTLFTQPHHAELISSSLSRLGAELSIKRFQSESEVQVSAFQGRVRPVLKAARDKHGSAEHDGASGRGAQTPPHSRDWYLAELRKHSVDISTREYHSAYLRELRRHSVFYDPAGPQASPPPAAEAHWPN
jgi:hypothetical protein